MITLLRIARSQKYARLGAADVSDFASHTRTSIDIAGGAEQIECLVDVYESNADDAE